MLEKVLPHAILKAKLNLESRIRTLKRDWTIVYDLLNIVEEIDAKNVAIGNNLEKRNIYCGCEYEVCLDEMDVSATQSQPLKPNE
ncbi:hypothetical protein Goklo_012795, partial [Gossypium klotzschianum]|nr:hypothetical protein [Gossypium klotzschianum]